MRPCGAAAAAATVLSAPCFPESFETCFFPRRAGASGGVISAGEAPEPLRALRRFCRRGSPCPWRGPAWLSGRLGLSRWFGLSLGVSGPMFSAGGASSQGDPGSEGQLTGAPTSLGTEVDVSAGLSSSGPASRGLVAAFGLLASSSFRSWCPAVL
ncbi:unnamed protein product [Prorocentrum cordatum]|uniref:Secreted protein n=1 Tax=Prorocentrum cordatum TaxID=2364126 RepID=A0ABN9WAN1_9DINO|nr:unnamed protein product [Polarella glacialis]